MPYGMVRVGSNEVVGSRSDKILPSKLAKEPMIEAIFEMRFTSSAPVAAMLPGILYSKLEGSLSMEQLPIQAMPKEIRDSDPSFMHIPLTKCSWGNYWLLIGDRVFSVASKLPYRGWADFKEKILSAHQAVLSTGLITTVDRCSIKYVDILDGVTLPPSDCFSMELVVGGSERAIDNFHVKVGISEGDVTHTVQLISRAVTELVGKGEVQGALIDVDSVIEISHEPASIFLDNLSDRAERLHAGNKKTVFGAISEKALQYLEPSYE